ncbi:MAG: tyrosine-type recombinase/integrase [Candidatus Promineifilaceae bacterium]
MRYFGDEIPDLKDITPHDIKAFLHTLKTTAPDNRSFIPREPKPLSPKSIRNAHGTLSSLWEWVIEEGLAKENIVRAVKPPNPKLPAIQPFEADEIRKLLRQTGQGETAELRPKDRTLILFLLDTGVRVSELINLRIRDADLRLGTALVQGKGRLDSGQGKQRMVYFGDRVKRSLQRYLSERGEPEPGHTCAHSSRQRPSPLSPRPRPAESFGTWPRLTLPASGRCRSASRRKCLIS